MGMDAIVFGVGSFYKEIIDLMPYPDRWYEDVAEGEQVCGTVAYAQTTDESKLLAWCVGVDIDSMNWTISPHRISAKLAKTEGNDRMVEQVRDLKTLTNYGWKLYFDPQA